MALIELFYWLRRLDYDGYLCYDTVAMTHDPTRIIAESVLYTRAMVAAADRINKERMEEIFISSDAPSGLGLVRDALFHI
jgi:hypothetical protein